MLIITGHLTYRHERWRYGGSSFQKAWNNHRTVKRRWKGGENAVRLPWKNTMKYGEKRWKTIVTVRHCGDGNGDGNHDGDGESSVTVGVNYGENGEVRVTVTVTVKDGERRFHRTFTVVHTYGETVKVLLTVITVLHSIFTVISHSNFTVFSPSFSPSFSPHENTPKLSPSLPTYLPRSWT